MSLITSKIISTITKNNNVCTLAQRYIASKASDYVRIVEVGPRDGLQNEKKNVPTASKIQFIDMLSDCGFKSIEVTSFVSPKWVPQLADGSEVFSKINKIHGVSYPVLIPNLKGLESAMAVGVQEIAVMGSASDTFSMKNLNCSSEEGINRLKTFFNLAKENNIKVRGYISCTVGCPYEGKIKPINAVKITEALLELGCYEISLADTNGVGTPGSIKTLLKDVLKVVSSKQLAIHCHDTYGQALTNIYTALEMDIRVVDSSVSGLGGCPYAKGATGNVATEDLVYQLNGMGVETGVNLEKLMKAGDYICRELGKPSDSKVHRALSKIRN